MLFLCEKRNQNASTFRYLLRYFLTFRTCMLSNHYIAAVLLNSLLRMLLLVFYELYSSHSACCVWLCSFSKMNASFLRRCALISKRKQHTFGTLSHIKLSCTANNKSFLKRAKCLFRFKSFKSKHCKNKLSSKQRNPSL